MSFSLFIEILNSLWFRIHLQRPLKALKTTASNSNFRREKQSPLPSGNLIDPDRRKQLTRLYYIGVR